MALPKVRKKEYLKRHGNRCPYCSSEDLRTLGQPSVYDECIKQDVQCLYCGKTWTDIYTLSDIEE